MIETFLELFLVGLQLAELSIANKYINQVTSLKEQWYAEYNKPDGVRSNAVLDNIDIELRNLAAGFAAEVRASKAGNLPG